MNSNKGVCLALAVVTLCLYGQTARFEFVTLDDNLFIADNPMVSQGLTMRGVAWAFSLRPPTGYSPLSWLSHMIDCSVLGADNAGGHHLVNAALHAANVVLLFLLLGRWTGARWRSAAVALLLAVHPLHVESVAWIAERRDVLAMFGCLLSLHAYARYVRSPGAGRYMLTALCFVLALLSKPIAVTLPCAMLLLDYWPLQRGRPWRQLVMEKIPLLVLSAGSSVLTFLAQSRGGAVTSMEAQPLAYRLQNTVVGYGGYLWKLVRPIDLAAYYTKPPAWPTWQVVLAGGVLIVITAAALKLANRRRYLIVGWLWYLGTMLPMIGLVSVGLTWMADRHAYLPLVGIYIAAVWGAAEVVPRRVLRSVAPAVYLLLAALGWMQIGYWRDSLMLYTHALRVQWYNPPIHNNLGNLLLRRGLRDNVAADLDQAAVHYRAAIEQRPIYWDPRLAYGKLLMHQQRERDALPWLEQALTLAKSDEQLSMTYYALGVAHLRLGEMDRARAMLLKNLKIRPRHERSLRFLRMIDQHLPREPRTP